MLTGDKLETAICISISSGLKNPREEMYIIRDLETVEELNKHLEEFRLKCF